MIPVVALVGRPNVGKSTLFNQLTRTRNALVADFPGLTRDRQYGHAEWEDHKFIVIDTGGIDDTEDVMIGIARQSLLAIEEANIVLFIVDGRTGLMAADEVIAQQLRSRAKTTIIVVNKTDGIYVNSAVGDFYALGMGSNIIPIAATHRRGINCLLEQILLLLMSNDSLVNIKNADNENILEEELSLIDKVEIRAHKETKELFDYQSLPIKMAIVGRPNVGKSMLTNSILGEERVIVYNMPGTTRDSIYIPMRRDNRQYVLIDTAGIRKRSNIIDMVEKFSVVKTLQAIADANVVLIVINAQEGIVDQDVSLLGFILHSGRSLVVAVNKCDVLSRERRNEITETLNHRLGFINFARVHFISALNGIGVSNLFKSVNEAYTCATKRVSTALLTRILRIAVNKHQPPLVRGHRVKPKYAHAGGYNPPIIVIHGTQVTNLPDSYKRYLISYFRRSLELIGTPIRIQFNEASNPFSGRRNILTLKQLRKRKRLMRYIKKTNTR